MSRALDKHRIAIKYDDGDSVGEGSDDAKSYGGMISTLAQAGGEIASTQLKKKEDAKKAAADKAASEEAQKKMEAADKAASDARNTATAAANDARIAALKAQQEKESYGPLHVAAQNAADKAAMRDSEAKVLEAKAMALHPGKAIEMHADTSKGQSAGVPTWVYYAAGGVGVLALGLIGYKLLSGGRDDRGYRPQRYSRGGR